MAFEKLFEPGEIASLKIKNRIVMAPMHMSWPIDQRCFRKEYFVRRAQGGAGLIIGGMTAIDPKYTHAGMNELYSDASIAGFFDLTNAIHIYGAKFWIQLWHPGRQWDPYPGHDNPPVAPSPIPCRALLSGERPVPHELTISEIEDLEDKFAQAAKRAQKSGADGIELHAAHGYLINQFLSSATNKRLDKYGGDIERRSAFILEIIEKIQKLCGKNYPLGVRMNGDDYIDGGNNIEDYKLIAKFLENSGVSCISVSGGMNESKRDRLYGYATAPVGIDFGWFIHLAEAIKRVVNIPVIAAGGLGANLELAESVLNEGKADFIAIGRPLIADPDLPVKIISDRTSEINWCIRCHECHPEERDMLRKPIARCGVNALAFKEGNPLWQISPATTTKKVMVVGGGPGGMESARVARLRGHDVSLYEKSDRLGGKVWLAAAPPYKTELVRNVEYLENELNRLGVKIIKGTEVTPSHVSKIRPDVVILATGSKFEVPNIPGINGENVLNVEDVLLKKKKTGKKVVLLGGNGQGAEVADFLQRQGARVTILSRRSREVLEENDGRGAIHRQEKERFPDFWGIARDLPRRYRIVLMLSLEKGGLSALFGCQINEINKKGVRITRMGGEHFIEADTVVLSWGSTPNNALYEKLNGRASELYLVGDCISPRTIPDAINEGAYIGMRI